MELDFRIPFSAGNKCLFIGDSITDAGRDECGEATPWNPGAGQGNGYVGYLNAILNTRFPAAKLRIVNRGVSGHTVHDLAKRWQDDVIDLAPDWLIVMIGINDVWRQFDCPMRLEMHHSIESFERVYRDLLSQTRPMVKGLVLITPYVIEPNRDDPMRKAMDAHGSVVKRLAAEFDAVCVDSQATFDRLTIHFHPASLAWDRIHPNPTGHMALALAFLDSVQKTLT